MSNGVETGNVEQRGRHVDTDIYRDGRYVYFLEVEEGVVFWDVSGE